MSVSRHQRELQEAIWRGSLPLEVSLAPQDCRTYEKSIPFYAHCPRLSYLPLLLPRLRTFFKPDLIDPDSPNSTAWFSFDGLPLKWHYPIGLLYDLFSGAAPFHGALTPQGSMGQQQQPSRPQSDTVPKNPLPWRLVLHFSELPSDQLVKLDDELKVLHDSFVNSIKEADFLRNGTAKAIMSLPREDSVGMWEAVMKDDYAAFTSIHSKIIPDPNSLRHIPLRIYLPTSSDDTPPPPIEKHQQQQPIPPARLKVVQPLIPASAPNPNLAGGGGRYEAPTLGAALHAALPTLFPSRRTPIFARPVLHGAAVPLGARLEDLMRGAAYLDGWLHFGIEMVG